MTVKELIECLSKCDPFAIVWVGGYGDNDPYEMDSGMIQQEIWEGDRTDTVVLLGIL